MPPHHHHDHSDILEAYWEGSWKDLPPHLKTAAGVLGWTQKLWDADGKADTEELGWHDLSHEQRKAAEEFGFHPKLWDDGHGHRHAPPSHEEMEEYDHYHWDELPSHLKDAAQNLGWNEKLWDEGGKADTEDTLWKNLTAAQRKAAEQFGYHPVLWDEGKGFRFPPPSTKTKEEEEKKEEDKKKNEAMFKLSKSFGGDGGVKFDHGNNKQISKITVYTDGHVVTGLEVKYNNSTKKSGGCGGKATTFELAPNEFITSVTVRSNKLVQSLGFKTQKGRMMGPVGGKGWSKIDPRGNDSEGEEVTVPAPFKYQLCGFTGQAGTLIDQVAFRWCSVVLQQGSSK